MNIFYLFYKFLLSILTISIVCFALNNNTLKNNKFLTNSNTKDANVISITDSNQTYHSLTDSILDTTLTDSNYNFNDTLFTNTRDTFATEKNLSYSIGFSWNISIIPQIDKWMNSINDSISYLTYSNIENKFDAYNNSFSPYLSLDYNATKNSTIGFDIQYLFIKKTIDYSDSANGERKKNSESLKFKTIPTSVWYRKNINSKILSVTGYENLFLELGFLTFPWVNILSDNNNGRFQQPFDKTSTGIGFSIATGVTKPISSTCSYYGIIRYNNAFTNPIIFNKIKTNFSFTSIKILIKFTFHKYIPLKANKRKY